MTTTDQPNGESSQPELDPLILYVIIPGTVMSLLTITLLAILVRYYLLIQKSFMPTAGLLVENFYRFVKDAELSSPYTRKRRLPADLVYTYGTLDKELFSSVVLVG